MNNSFAKALKAVFAGTLMFMTWPNAMAQGDTQPTPRGVVVHGNVYGGGNLADVKTNTEVNMSTGTVEGNVYGGGNLGDVGTHADQDPVSVGNYDWKDQDGNTITNTTAAAKMTGVSKVTITGGTVGVENSAKPKEQGNVFGGGKGAATTFECEKGMVYKTSVSIQKSGTTNTLVYRNVYGGGEVSRVENDTEVTIGTASGTDEPNIKGSVFAAGAGVETHGYSALVRGHSTVTVQGKATVEHNVYGGGELASVGRYKVKTPANASDTDVPATLPYGMPAHLIDGGKNTVTITDNAVIGTEGDNTTGHVYGAGKGLEPREYDYASQTEGDTEYDIDDHQPKRMVSGNTWEHFANVAAYLQFVETLALTAETEVTITGSAGVIGSVFGGSESGFVYQDTEVKIQNGTINGNVFGGGRGLESFAEAGRVKGNTTVTMSNGSVAGNVYGGGNLGDVGTIYKDAKDQYGNLTYNYVWRNSDANGNVNDTEHNNTTEYNKPSGSSHDTSKNTGVCNVTINGGTIGTGVTQNSDGTFTKGNVYGAGRGSDITWWCEKAIAYATNVTITAGTVNGTVYGGGQIGRVEDDAKVTIGVADADATGDAAPIISGNVFGAGAGLHTHGYSALVRGNSDVTVQGTAQVGGSVYGGGEIASVGKFRVDKGLPKEPLSGGYCTVTIQDNAKIGTSGTEHNVYGACKGVDPATINSSDRMSMQLFANRPKDANGNYKAENDGWSYYPSNHAFVWVTYTEDDYPAFLRTLALTSHPHVTIAESASVFGSVYGGGQRGITLGNVDVDITGGTVYQDVYGGGALADTNAGNWDADDFTEVTGLTADVSSVTGLYTLSGTTYTIITDEDAKAVSGTTYYSKGKWADATKKTANYTTTVDLTGGHIKGDAYGGGLGQKTGFKDALGNTAQSDIAAVVWGDIDVTLDGTKFDITYYEDTGYTDVVKSGRVFGCNNLNGSPQGNVTVDVYKTVAGSTNRTSSEAYKKKVGETDYVAPTYELAAVYGGGNLADYAPTTSGKKANVIIETCDVSVQSVYGGGNAADVPETDVLVKGAYEIAEVFGGGNGKDSYTTDGGTSWTPNNGADVNGPANTLLKGGYIHEAYGGSNSKGTISGNVSINKGPGGACTLQVDELYGAGKDADVEGDLIVILGCSETRTEAVYGCSMNANVKGNVELTITSGEYGKVFGGNNLSGSIFGHIIVNIEEISCSPIKIDELYLGGNDAAYSVYGYYQAKKYEETESGVTKLYLDAEKTIPIYKDYATDYLYKDKEKTKRLYEDASTHFLYVNEEKTKPLYMPRTSAYTQGDPNGIVTFADLPHTIPNSETKQYDDPELNIISCTSIGQVFGGGLGTGASLYGNPKVNINMIAGKHADEITRNGVTDNENALGEIGDVYGGGSAADVIGNTSVNIGTLSSVNEIVWDSSKDEPVYQNGEPSTTPVTVLGAYITGNVYGGGKLADVGKYHEVEDPDPKWAGSKYIVVDKTGNTNVNICAKYNTASGEWESVAEGTAGVKILGNVYGGGMGSDESFYCDKAMVLGNLGISQGGGTNVRIGNGTIKRVVRDDGTVTGNVYGGGEIARVDNNTAVTIGYGAGDPTTPTSTPVIEGTVFGAGAGLRTHGYSALVRGHSSVTIEGNAKIEQSVYGGGELATVGRHYVVDGVAKDCISGGESTVIIGGYAEIGPNDMVMYNTTTGKPDDYGHVFGAGKGTQPYEGFADSEQPWSKIPNVYDEETGNLVTDRTLYKKFSALVGNEKLPNNYVTYLRTLALTTKTEVTIKDHAFVKGCVFGGSENGFVLQNTKVTIQDDCQIGNGYVQMTDDGTYLDKLSTPLTPLAVNRRYTEDEWTAGHLIMGTSDRQALKDLVSPGGTPTYYTSSLPECASWPYGQATNAADRYAPYDKDANTTGDLTKYANGNSTEGGRAVGDDGHTFYGSVFGGGSGYYPYKPGRWFEDAGAVYGNASVVIKGGHILTSVYGGNEMTDVGKYELDKDGKPTTKITSGGKCTITMSGGTLGVPRTLKQIGAHPVTCYLFGAGKGDQRVFFNKSTNVGDVEVNIKGGTIYGSVFGGGEDGHVMRDVTMTISDNAKIGTWGTSYVDGNVFGGGRGFAGDAYTAGNVAGSVTLNISGGTMLGSIYGGGRLGSVGYGLYEATETEDATGHKMYGEMQDDGYGDWYKNESDVYVRDAIDGFKRGYVEITISGGTIGNDREYIIPNATNMAAAGIPENYRDISKWDDVNKYWDKWKEYHKIPKTEFDTTTGRLTHTKGGNVFAGGMGNFYKQDGQTYINGVDWWKLGNARSTTVTITGGTIKSNVYGGGELGQVVGHHTTTNAAGESINASTEISISGSSTQIGTEVKETVAIPASGDTPASTSEVTSYTFGSVFGGGYGSLLDEITVNNGTSDVTSKPKFIAGLVKEDTKIDMQGGAVKASIYGGGEMASVGESTTSGETTTATGSTYVSVSGGTVGIEPIVVSGTTRYFGGAKMGNVYGGGSGHGNTVRSGKIFNSTNVTISDGIIYHNVYGGGAYGTVGEFNYTEDPNENNKVVGVKSLKASGTGIATVTITGGTIGYDGKENGMVFGSSRGDINQPGERDDHTAWVYNANVTIGTAATPASGTPDTEGYVAATPASGPDIKGSVYGSGENGHTFNNTVVTVNGGTIGIDDENDDGFTVTSNGTTYEGAAYPYRGNVYGGGCGTDKYYSNHALETHDGNGQLFNPLAGIVYGTTRVDITGGTVVRNVYGAGAMGSVGRTVTTTNSDNSTTTTYSGGSTTINVSGGVIGVSGTVGDGNVFGAARGDLSATGDYISQVRLTNVTVSGGTVKGNVYGGGELGDVGTIDKSDQTDYNYYWTDKDGSANIHGNNGISGTNNNTGICTVTVSGGTIGTDATTMNADGSFDNGNVFGAGKGSGSTWWCEKAIAYGTNVTVTAGTVKGSVYGGGEVGRVEDDAKVTIGSAPNDAPTINGSVFGAGKGLKTHGYSALVRGNAEVIVQGKSVVRGSVYGGGEIASVGKFHVDKGLPVKPMNGGTCKVLIQDEAQIGLSGTGHNVFGACKGVKSAYDLDNYKNFKSMQTEANGAKGTKGTDWDYYEDYPQGYTGHKFVWKYYTTEAAYLSFLKTLALTSNTHVTIDEDASVYGSVFGGGERGVTLGGVDVNITGGTVNEDVYGGGSLADSNTAMWDAKENERVDYVELTELIAETSATGYYTKSGEVYTLLSDATAKVESGTTYYAKYKTNVNLKGGTIVGSVYGGGLGQLAKAAVNYTEEEATTYNTTHNLTEGDADYKTTASVKVAALSAVEAKVYGDVLVNLNETTESDNCVIGSLVNANDPVSKNGNIFGCNNLNGSPQAGVTVHIHKTAQKNNEGNVTAKPDKNKGTYELQAVYGGGNLAAYYPDDATSREKAKANVIIDGCGLTSIGTVYGGGNAASVPATEVVVNGTYEIGQVFGGGNGADDYQLDGKWYDNPGANVGLMSYAYFVKEGDTNYNATTHGSGTETDPYKVFEYTSDDGSNKDASDKTMREANYGYGIGKAHATIYGGTVHTVYGGSNSRGNVRVESRTTLEDGELCQFNVGDAFGGGNNAAQDGDAILEVGCITGLEIAYGGASNADVNGDVKLNLTNGTYGRVFGGNNLGGAISGSIIVNIEETGCNPIVIGELYCGGNKAAYSVYGYNNDGSVKTSGDNPVPDPVLNVKSFTSIGKIFGGGYGEEAVMVANPTVNINVVKGRYSDEKVIAEGESVHGFDIPSHKAGDIGAIGSVFGGGNAAEVIGTPHVNIGTKVGEVIPLVSKPIEDSEGRAPSGPDWTSYQLVTVEGVDIRGNVYGAGNNAQVTGDTEVVIGKNNDIKTYSFTSYGSESGVDAWSSGLAQTTGVIKNGLAEVEILTNGKYVSYVGQKYYVAPNATADGTERTELKNKDGESLSPKLYVAVKPFEQKTYTFTSHSAENGGTQYSTGTAAPTGNFKTFGGQEYMQIVVLTNPNYVSWEGKTFYVSVNAKTDGSETTRLYKADGTAEDVWVSISEQ